MEGEIAFAGYLWGSHFGAFICSHVFEGKPVKLVCYESDGDLCFVCGEDGHQTDHPKLAGLAEIIERHPEVADVPTLSRGEYAEKAQGSSDWTVGTLTD